MGVFVAAYAANRLAGSKKSVKEDSLARKRQQWSWRVEEHAAEHQVSHAQAEQMLKRQDRAELEASYPEQWGMIWFLVQIGLYGFLWFHILGKILGSDYMQDSLIGLPLLCVLPFVTYGLVRRAWRDLLRKLATFAPPASPDEGETFRLAYPEDERLYFPRNTVADQL